MERRYKIILTIAGVIVLIGILAFVLRPKGDAQEPSGSTNQPGGTVPIGGISRSGTIVQNGGETVEVTPPPAPPAEIAVRQLAATFAERYGTFSSEGNFVNVTDLYPIVTQRYRQELEQFVARERAKPAGAFSSTTTAVITTTAELTPTDAPTRATVRVSTQRTTENNGTTKTYNQTLVIELEKSSIGWLISTARWETASNQ